MYHSLPQYKSKNIAEDHQDYNPQSFLVYIKWLKIGAALRYHSHSERPNEREII